jgi:hypothetical protein
MKIDSIHQSFDYVHLTLFVLIGSFALLYDLDRILSNEKTIVTVIITEDKYRNISRLI